MERRNFLLVVQGPELDPEHANITATIERHSGGDFVEVFKQNFAERGARAAGKPIPFVIAYFFSTETHPADLDFGLLNGDRSVLLEIGGLCWVEGLSRSRAWLERH